MKISLSTCFLSFEVEPIPHVLSQITQHARVLRGLLTSDQFKTNVSRLE